MQTQTFKISLKRKLLSYEKYEKQMCKKAKKQKHNISKNVQAKILQIKNNSGI